MDEMQRKVVGWALRLTETRGAYSANKYLSDDAKRMRLVIGRVAQEMAQYLTGQNDGSMIDEEDDA